MKNHMISLISIVLFFITLNALAGSHSSPDSSKTDTNQSITFKLKKIEIQGNNVFSCDELEKIFIDKMNRDISFDDLEQITQDLTRYYRNAGYVLSRAILPAQKIDDGIVRIQIFEGHISKFNLDTNTDYPNRLLESYGIRIIESRPLEMEILERYTLLANDIPGVSIRTVISPSETEPGTADLTFAGTEDTFNGVIGLDNRGSRFTGRNEFFFGGNVNSLFRFGDSTGIQALVTDKKNAMHFLNLNHLQFLNDNGTQLFFSESYVHSNPGLIVSPLNIFGKAYIFSTQLSQPVLRQQLRNFTPYLKLDVIHNNTNMLNFRLFHDRISSLRAGFIFDFFDCWQGFNAADFTLSKGLPIFGASHKNAPYLSRPKGRSTYTKVTLQLSRLQKLFYPWSLYVAGRGQCAFNRLLAAEQFTYGGAIFGRGYDPSSITGDDGFSVSAELRYNKEMNMDIFKNCRFQCVFNTIEYYAFYDYGMVWKPLPLLPYRMHEEGSSLGIGSRMNFGNLYAYGELAKPLKKILIPNDIQGTHLRIFFGAFYKF